MLFFVSSVGGLVVSPMMMRTSSSLRSVVKMKAGQYCESRYVPSRRSTCTVEVGPVKLGSEHPIACQTMSTTDTRDVEASVAQILRCVDQGADLVRLTVQGLLEAKKSAEIRKSLFEKGVDVPLVADIHFQPKAAMLVADAFEKIRVNPGNFADGTKSFEETTYDSPEEFEAERAYIEELFTPLVLKCKELNRAMRIGTNHGSLSARIMSFYGDSPAGMVESALEFANICRKHDYHNFVFSMKASNPVVMVQAYRSLAEKMYELGWDYPLHLGVTEAGEGEDGRMKSAIGIGALLADGLGDTIRVSLTEDPEFELEPCKTLADLGYKACSDEAREKAKKVPAFDDTETRLVASFNKRDVMIPKNINDEGETVAALHRDGSVLTTLKIDDFNNKDEQTLYRALGCQTALGMPFRDVATSDSIFLKAGTLKALDKTQRRTLDRIAKTGLGIIIDAAEADENNLPENTILLTPLADFSTPASMKNVIGTAVVVRGDESDEDLKRVLIDSSDSLAFALLDVPTSELSRLHATRRIFHVLKSQESQLPVIHKLTYDPESAKTPSGILRKDLFILKMGMDGGSLFVDGLGDGVLVDAPFDVDFLRTASFGLLQGSRMRNVKTEFVSCPSCGRTLFDLQEVSERIAEATGHLPGVTIAIMGCIVNGPGEMADADFGYVGSLPGKVDLYVGKEVVRKGIPNDDACDALVQLIKDNDRWVDPKEVEEASSSPGIEQQAVAA